MGNNSLKFSNFEIHNLKYLNNFYLLSYRRPNSVKFSFLFFGWKHIMNPVFSFC